MTFIWEIKLYEMAKGFRVIIKGDGRTVEGQGPTPYKAYRWAENQLVRKPGFFIPDAAPAAPLGEGAGK